MAAAAGLPDPGLLVGIRGVGRLSHAAYAASNRMLDVLAAQLRRGGRECMAIRWGLWQSAGVVAANEITRTERSGLVAMDPELAMEASLFRYGAEPLIFDADFERLAVFFESQGMPIRSARRTATAARPTARTNR